ncbi:MAG TPA: hypothetical protein VNM37_01010, partial [Candidatus Dormibacteraeota bacterium]|nr:hypothetical protein [Candidatus Dormibacteraeota bacterium]
MFNLLVGKTLSKTPPLGKHNTRRFSLWPRRTGLVVCAQLNHPYERIQSMMLGRNSAGLLLFSLLLPGSWSAAWSAPLPVVPNVEWQPLAAQARRVIEALGYLGDP